MQGRIYIHFLEIISADIVYKFCRYPHLCINGGWGLRSHHLKRRIQGGQRQSYSPPPSAQKWYKINTFLDIRRKQSNFCLYKIALYYLLGRKQAKSDYFSEMRYLFKVRPPNPYLSLSAIDDLSTCRRFFHKNRSSQIKVKTGRQASDSPCRIFQKRPLPFRRGPTSMTIRLSLHNILGCAEK